MKFFFKLSIALIICTAPRFSMAEHAWRHVTADPSVEIPVSGVGSPGSVALSTDTFVVVPSSTTGNFEKRTEIILTNPAAQSAVITGFIGDSSTVAEVDSVAVATTTIVIEIPVGGAKSVRVDDGLFIWLKSAHTSTENVHYQELKQ